MPAGVEIRPMTAADVPAAEAVARAALYDGEPGVDDPVTVARGLRRIGHLQRTDPDGAWVAEAPGGALVGMALALVREGIWGLSLFGVAAEHRSRGIGRELLDAAFTTHGAHARGHLILSSESPAAMRRYARLGLDLRPCVAAAGIPDRARLAAQDGDVRDAGADGVTVADAIGRAVRGAGHGVDLPVALQDPGARLLLVEDRAFALVREGRVSLVAGLDEDAATRALNAALAAMPAGATASVDFLTAGQDWAVRACLDAGLVLSPDGPFFTGGDLGPLRPYVPSGAYL
jgi:ribosomal protein S18 acetylase RimI-like enzyme